MNTYDRNSTGGRPAPTASISRHASGMSRPIAHVLVPLDGSAVSEDALAYAAAVARRTGARLTLVHVREESDAIDGTPDSYPASLLGDPRLGHGLEVRAEALSGPVRDVLLAHAEASGTDLIIMTSRGRGGIRRALFGSVADAIVRRAEVPVLVVRPGDDTPPADARPRTVPFRRVLLPLDGSAIGERIVPHALALTGTADVHYVLLRVRPALTVDGRIEPGPILGQRAEPGGDGYLSTMAARIADQGVLVSTRSVVHVSNPDVIVATARDEEVDLVAMTTRGAGGADRMIFGSVADEVLRRAPCHVLVLRPPPADAPAESIP